MEDEAISELGFHQHVDERKNYNDLAMGTGGNCRCILMDKVVERQ